MQCSALEGTVRWQHVPACCGCEIDLDLTPGKASVIFTCRTSCGHGSASPIAACLGRCNAVQWLLEDSQLSAVIFERALHVYTSK